MKDKGIGTLHIEGRVQKKGLREKSKPPLIE